MAAVVELDHISKSYENKIAVKDLSLRIDAGTMFGLLGPNGAGKTTTIRMMMGITMPDSGKVSLFDKPFERKSLERVGYLPEERGLYKKMKVLEQLVFFGQLHGLGRADAESGPATGPSAWRLPTPLPKKTEELSKGMQQKIQFIASLLHDPGLIVMDEPFSGLDPVNAVAAGGHAARTQGTRQGHPLFHPSHGPGRKALRLHLPHRTTARPCSPAACARSSHATSATTSSSNSRAAPSSCTAPRLPKAKNFSGHAEIRLKPHGDAQKLLR